MIVLFFGFFFFGMKFNMIWKRCDRVWGIVFFLIIYLFNGFLCFFWLLIIFVIVGLMGLYGDGIGLFILLMCLLVLYLNVNMLLFLFMFCLILLFMERFIVLFLSRILVEVMVLVLRKMVFFVWIYIRLLWR